MEATDLMNGDWVINANIPKQVLGVVGHKALFLEGKTKMWLPLHACYPIPLTQEIFEKNGFERNEFGGYEIIIYDGDVLEINVEEIPICNKLFFHIRYSCLGVTYQRHCIDMQIDFVHELQQALRLLGIEKEIVL